MRHVPPGFKMIMILSVTAWALSKGIQELFVEPHISRNLSAFVSMAPIYPIMAVAFVGGAVAASLKQGLFHALIISAVFVGGELAFSLWSGREYVHDLFVGDPGFMSFVSQQLLLLFGLSAILVEATFAIRAYVLRMRRPV